MRLVIKIGGNEIDSPDFLSGIAAIIRDLHTRHEIVIVHGAGKEISNYHEKLHVAFETINGRRKTSPESMQIVEMVLKGLVNTRLVRTLVNEGVDAIGISGVDLGLIKLEPFDPALDRVGRITEIKIAPLEGFLAQEYLPVIAASVSMGTDGSTMNINADEAAAAIAVSLRADFLILVSNVPGVLKDGEIIAELDSRATNELMESGVISGGMIPKVESALAAIKSGVKQTLICNLSGLINQEGTVFKN